MRFFAYQEGSFINLADVSGIKILPGDDEGCTTVLLKFCGDQAQNELHLDRHELRALLRELRSNTVIPAPSGYQLAAYDRMQGLIYKSPVIAFRVANSGDGVEAICADGVSSGHRRNIIIAPDGECAEITGGPWYENEEDLVRYQRQMDEYLERERAAEKAA